MEHSDNEANTSKEISTTKRNESNKIFSLINRPTSNVHRSLSSSSENSEDHLSESSTSEQSSPGNLKNMRCNSSSNEIQKEMINSNIESENADDILSTTKVVVEKGDEITQSIQDDNEILNIGGNDSTKEVSGMLFLLTFINLY